MSGEKSQQAPVKAEEPEDLATAVRKVSRGMERLLASGLNKRAVLVLLCHATKLGHGTVAKVVDALGELERSYTVQPKKGAK